MSNLKVKVKYLTILRELTGRIEETFELEDGMCLEDLIEKIVTKYGEKIRRHLYANEKQKILNTIILINGRHMNMLQGLKTKLNNGDIVTIMLPAGGG